MVIVTSRADFEKLIDLRMAEAKLLMDHLQDWDVAFYLAGYAVEFALKVRIIAELHRTDGFPGKKLAEDFYKHDLTILRRAAGLEVEMDSDPQVKPYWLTVSQWTEQCRYQVDKTEPDTKKFYMAIESEVLPWIKARW